MGKSECRSLSIIDRPQALPCRLLVQGGRLQASFVRHDCQVGRRIDSSDFDLYYLEINVDFFCIYRLLSYCWFMSLWSTWVNHLDFEVRLRQVRSNRRAFFLLPGRTSNCSLFAWLRRSNFMLALTVLAGVLTLVTDSFSSLRRPSSHKTAFLRSTCDMCLFRVVALT